MQIQELIDDDILPDLPNDIYWSKHLVESVGNEIGSFLFFDNAFMQENNDYNIEDLDDIIGYLLAIKFSYGIAKRGELESLLWREGIIGGGRAIPEGQFFDGSSIQLLGSSGEIVLSQVGKEKYEKIQSA